MLYRLKNYIVFIAIAVFISACGGTQDGDTFPTEPLYLDYTLPLNELGLTLEDLSGITFDYEEDYFVILSESGDIATLDSAGVLLDSFQLNHSGTEQWTDIVFIGSNQYFISSDSGLVYRLEMLGRSLSEVFDLSNEIDALHAIGFNPMTENIILISDAPKKRLFSIDSSGTISQTELDPRFENYSITGLQVGEQGIYISAITKGADMTNNSQAEIIQLNEANVFQRAWALGETPISGVMAIDEDAPRFFTTHKDLGASIKTYEPAPIPSVPEVTPLSPLDELVLSFDQPSDIHFHHTNGLLYYVTDFGEVRRGDTDGSNELLFAIENLQGSYEAITVSDANEEIDIFILKSDERTEASAIDVYNEQGTFKYSINIEKQVESHVFESLEYNAITQTFYLINGNEDMTKYVYLITEGVTETMTLPSDYDQYRISGMALAGDNAFYFVTDEYTQDETKFAGLFIEYDLENAEEMHRFSITNPSDPSIGLISPSGVAINGETSTLYITSDTDDSILGVYETP